MWVNVVHMRQLVFDKEGFKRAYEVRGLGIAELAERTGISESGLYKIRQGARSPKPSNYAAIIKALGLKPGDLLIDPSKPTAGAA